MKKHNYLLFNIIIFLSLFISCSKQENKYKLIPIKSAEKWGYINHKGEYVINPQFIEADFFYEGLAKVKGFDEKIGYISEDGKYEIDANYKNGTIFSDGLAFVVSEGSFPTCIDKKGNTKFVLKDVEFIFAFEEGLAAFKNTEGKWGFIDTKGDIVINAQFEAVGSFNDGYAIIIQNGKRGFINKEGKIVINPQFEHVTIFSEGKAAFFDGKQWGYIDTKGTYIINPQFDEATVFNGGLALVKQGKYYGYINKQGKFEINPQFEEACSFSNKLAVVQLGKTFGYINKQGKYEINPQFEFALEFYNDIAPVLNSEKWGFIDKKGKYVINPQFEAIKIDVEFERSMSMWNFISNYSNNYYVESDYYDASEFVAEFFKKDTGNSFDSINVSTNLKNLAYHETYGNDLQTNNKYYANYTKKIEVTKDIFISNILFHFNEPIYKEVTTYSKPKYWWEESYKTGTRKEYNFTIKPSYIEYKFNLSGKAVGKNNTIANALRLHIEQQYNLKMETKDNKYYYVSR